MSEEIFKCVITPGVKTYQIKSITWGQHMAVVIACRSRDELAAWDASRRTWKLWQAMRNSGAVRSRRRRKYWMRIADRHIRSIDMDGR